MRCKPRKLKDYKDGTIRPSKVGDVLLYTYTKPLTLVEFLVNVTPSGVKKEMLEEAVDIFFSNDSFIRKTPIEAAALSYGIKNFKELDGENIFDVFKSYDIISQTNQIDIENSFLDDLVEALNSEYLFTKGGDCKIRAIFFINLLRNYKFPCRMVKGRKIVKHKKKDDRGHMWIEINYGGIWVPFEPHAGINLVSNNKAVKHYSKYPTDISFSKP